MIVLRHRWGRVWARRLDVAGAIRIRDLAGLDVMELFVDDDLHASYQTPNPEATGRIVDALYALFLPDVSRDRMTSRKFGRKLRCMTAQELHNQFLEELGEFVALPNPRPIEESENQDDERPSPTAAGLWEELWWTVGQAGVDPDHRTFGELRVIAQGYERSEWPRAARITAAVINSAPFRRGKAVSEAKLDPTGALKSASPGKQSLNKESFRGFARMFGFQTAPNEN